MDGNFEKLLNDAYKLHISGQLEDAKNAYEKLIKINPDDVNLLNLYAQLNFALKNYDISLKIFYKIYEETKLEEIKINILKNYFAKSDYENVINTAQTISNKSPDILRLEAKSYIELKNYQKAIDIYLNLINLKLHNEEDIFNLSLFYSYAKDYDNSLKYALEFYSKNNNDKSICLHLSFLYEQKNDIHNQLEYLKKAADISPNTDLYYNIGVLERQIGSEDAALNYFNEVVKANPQHKLAFLNIARIYQNRDKKIGLDIYEKLSKKFPDDLMILSQLYLAYKNIFMNEQAYRIALQIIDIDKEKSYSYIYAADALFSLGKYSEAISMYEKSQNYSDDNEYSDTMIANIYSILNQGEKAVEIFKTKYPHLLSKNDNYAYIQMCERNLEEVRDIMHLKNTGTHTEDELDKRAIQYFYKLNIDKKYNINEQTFKQFKTNKSKKDIQSARYYIKKDLYGHNPDNKRILIYNKNGMGDIIMFSRYLFVLEKHTKNITVQVPKAMFRLFKYNFPQFDIIQEGEIINENNYDYTSSFFGLLFNLEENTLKNIPYSKPYISIDDALVKEKENYDFIKNDKKKIGIFWMGNPVLMTSRSVKPDKFKPLFDIKNSQLYSFQIEHFEKESEDIKNSLPLFDLAPYITDYADTAAFLKKMDVLVTIDTSIANLAGAMGIKTFLLLPFDSEWRWFHDTETTPWYDSIRIFKQHIPFNWDEVIERVKNELTI